MMRFWYMLGCAIALATVLSLTGTPAWAYTQSRSDVVPCSLAGVNPAYHKAIFGNPETAAKYGFVKGPNGKWQVMKPCNIHNY